MSTSDLRSHLEKATYQYFPTDNGKVLDGDKVLARTSFESQTVTINNAAGFMTLGPSILPFGGFEATVTGDQYRTFVLLHELGHLAHPGAMPDSNNYDNNFNMGIVTDCLGVTVKWNGSTP